jgi:hypothetical protein
MTDTPLTDAKQAEISSGAPYLPYVDMCVHAEKLERDRARLLKALRWYARASDCSLRCDAGFMARTAIFEVEKSE